MIILGGELEKVKFILEKIGIFSFSTNLITFSELNLRFLRNKYLYLTK